MDNSNHNLLFKFSRLLPSSLTSCHFTTLPDVAQNSITNKLLHETPNPKTHSSQGRKCPPKMDKLPQKSSLLSVTHSSSSNSAWFTSGDDFSISSNSGDSFRLKSGRIIRKCEEMKSIDETGRHSYDTVLSKSAEANVKKGRRKSAKTWPEFEIGSDHISTQMYYGGSEANPKIEKNRRKFKKRESRRSLDCRSVIGESRAVEKSSIDPRGDFRASMVEMIVEKQIFAAADLERLLLCFLSLNAVSYHGIIFDVFSEICQTLFSN